MMKWAIAAVATIVMTSQPALAKAHPGDPWEGFNRSMFAFNEQVDKYVTKPAAKAYQWAVPQMADDSITRFFRNLYAPITLMNQLLQGKFHHAAETTSRFMFNSTLGIAGLLDVATPMGLTRKSEDFGQTLATWGVNSGPYLMLPLLGPSTLRDTVARPVDSAPDARAYMSQTAAFSLLAINLMDTRADLLSAEKFIEGDRYAFVRNYYLQQREFDIADGVVEHDPFLDDDIED